MGSAQGQNGTKPVRSEGPNQQTNRPNPEVSVPNRRVRVRRFGFGLDDKRAGSVPHHWTKPTNHQIFSPQRTGDGAGLAGLAGSIPPTNERRQCWERAAAGGGVPDRKSAVGGVGGAASTILPVWRAGYHRERVFASRDSTFLPEETTRHLISPGSYDSDRSASFPGTTEIRH